MGVMGLGRDYWKELDFATRISKKVASPYTIDIIEIPNPEEQRTIPRCPWCSLLPQRLNTTNREFHIRLSFSLDLGLHFLVHWRDPRSPLPLRPERIRFSIGLS
jgi:hypothetical protein